ncbi:MAG: alpha/beta hydrolase [Pyrinomonadaceae bacterium]|nr:alpha/beta hydrolase [Pyrinomonadaceae bacterium]
MLSVILLLASVVTAADGVPIHYEVKGNGDLALVFIHCWSCDRTLWENQVAVFAKDHRVVTIDLPGHGDSGKGRTNWSIESYGEDVKRVVTKLGLKRVVLVGSSMGGPVALEAARRMPKRVVAIVPVDTLQDVNQKMSAEQVEAMVKQIQSDYKGQITQFANQYLFAPGTPAAVKERVLAQALSMPPELGIPILKRASLYDPIPTMQKIKIPIQAINSDLYPTNLEGNRKYAPQFEAVIMKGVGHYPMLEDPARFNELLSGVLRDLRTAKSADQ